MQAVPDRGKGWDHFVDGFDINAESFQGRLQCIPDFGGTAKEYRSNEGFFYPIVTAPLADKTLDAAVCPLTHKQVAKDFLADCRKFLVIGTSGLDGDLMELLKSALHPGRSLHLNLVDVGNSGDQSLLNFRRGTGAFSALRGLGDSYIFKRGFRDYVSGQDIQNFAKFVM